MSGNYPTGEQLIAKVSLTASELPAPGSPAAAVVAPEKGSTGLVAGTPVIVPSVHFWDSPTIKAFLNLIYLAFGAVVLYMAEQIVSNGGVFGLDWTKIVHAAVNAGVLSLSLGFAAWWKARDNRPTA